MASPMNKSIMLGAWNKPEPCIAVMLCHTLAEQPLPSSMKDSLPYWSKCDDIFIAVNSRHSLSAPRSGFYCILTSKACVGQSREGPDLNEAVSRESVKMCWFGFSGPV